MSPPIATPWRQWAKDNHIGQNFAWRAIAKGKLKVRRVGKQCWFLTRTASHSSGRCLKDRGRCRKT
jgi:hypothetical protein